MIDLYYHTGNQSKKKAQQWLNVHQIEYRVRNINLTPLSTTEIKTILRLALLGTNEIIATRSKVIQNLPVDFEKMSFNQLVELIKENPGVLKSPILIDRNKMMAGFDSEKVGVFIPRKKRHIEMRSLLRRLAVDSPLPG